MIVYRHRRNDNLEIFYIGIGKEEKRAYSTKDRNKYWHNIVNKCGYTVEIIANPDTWEEACDLEMLLISEYGRKDLGTGQLVNMTDGGEGRLGLIHSAETRAKLSIAASNMSEETKQKISEAMKGNTYNLGKKHSEETKAKISAAQKGKKLSEETRAKMSIAQSNKSEETKAKISAAHKGKKITEKHKQQISEAQQGSKHHNAKLTEQQAYEIKYCNFNSTHKEIAFIYGVSKYTVSDIRNNKSWKHI